MQQKRKKHHFRCFDAFVSCSSETLFPGMVTFWFLTVHDMFHQYADALTNLSSFDFP